MGQQSMSGFLGLHVDVDLVGKENAKKAGLRKYGCVLINQGDKLTKELKEKLIEENREKYGLSKEYIKYLKLPKACNVKVYELHKIMDARKKLTTGEQIDHLLDIKKALEKRLSILKSGQKIAEFDYLSPQQYNAKYGVKSLAAPIKVPGEEQIEDSDEQ